MPARSARISLLVIAFSLALTVSLYAGPLPGNHFTQTNLVSDLNGVALHTDPDLVNPWGISFGPTSPFWVSDNGTGLTTLYDGSGNKQGLVVTIPPAAGSPGTISAPTGQVFNPTAAGGTFNGGRFIFATEDGTINYWSGGTTAIRQVDNSASGAIYKGLAITNDMLFATDFHNGKIDAWGSNFAPLALGGGAFTDPNLPSGFAPFGIQAIGGSLYVTYAKQDASGEDDVSGPGFGYIDVYDTNGNLLQRLVSGGALNSPWGLAVAPSGFGPFGGDLLVGNFGDGTINAFNLSTGALVGTLDDNNGDPLVNQGLWGIAFGNGGKNFNSNDLYFTAGIPGPDKIEDHGLFGVIARTPEPSSFLLLGAGMLGVIRLRRSR